MVARRGRCALCLSWPGVVDAEFQASVGAIGLTVGLMLLWACGLASGLFLMIAMFAVMMFSAT
jgi:hypothetical protein